MGLASRVDRLVAEPAASARIAASAARSNRRPKKDLVGRKLNEANSALNCEASAQRVGNPFLPQFFALRISEKFAGSIALF